MLKLDVSGNLLWSKYFGTTADDIPTDVKEMSHGKIMLCGYTFLNGAANTDILLINIDTAGTVIWSKTFGGAQKDYGFKIAASTDSSVVVAGQTFSFCVTASSGYAVKINSIGNIVWSVTTSGDFTTHTAFTSIDNTFDAGFILTGYWQDVPYYYVPVVKIDAFGSVVAAHGHPAVTYNSFGFDIKSIPGGDFIVVGKETTGADSGSVMVMRVNPPALSVPFKWVFATINYEIARSVVVTPDGNFAFAGSSLFNVGFGLTEKGFLSKINLSGNSLFNRNYQPALSYSSLNSLIVTHDNNLLSVGKVTSVLDSTTGIYVIKAQLNNGNTGCFESSFSIGSSSLFNPATVGINNNFGGLSNTVAASMAPANVLQNDLCSGNVGFQELSLDASEHSVSPNPSGGNFTIYFNKATDKNIRIFDVTGNIIYEKNKSTNSEEQINLSAHSKGIYLLKIFDKYKISVHKIVLQ